eukprot:TRINITY_DN11155_c0_g1_i5.p1 TRINITY_DN11155_c0_g1~~TRINITY_DN11155_c0_g1_i5.p1  ORF type:complete len:188 (+),score=17.31 TRINITY_DN11155_c0_g1_i5:31-564(+)
MSSLDFLPVCFALILFFFFFQAEDGIRDVERSRGLGDVYKRQVQQNCVQVLIVKQLHEIHQGELCALEKRALLLHIALLARLQHHYPLSSPLWFYCVHYIVVFEGDFAGELADLQLAELFEGSGVEELLVDSYVHQTLVVAEAELLSVQTAVNFLRRLISLQTVSYTHLTLPTICSV